jgi:hypothetical protein
MFSREDGTVLVMLKRSIVMLFFCGILWFFPFMNDLLYNKLYSEEDVKGRYNII